MVNLQNSITTTLRFTVCLILFLCVSHSHGLQVSETQVEDEEANHLLSFAATLQGPNWPPQSWIPASNPCTSNWSGITCTTVKSFLNQHSSVSLISLSERNLTGTFTMNGHLRNLQFLTSLNLSSNYIYGSIEPSAFPQSLQILSLSSNRLSGSIPGKEMSNRLPNIEVLDLSMNKLSGQIPPDLASLTKLRILNLFGNSLNGTIPPELGQLSQSLRQLALFSNRLYGQIPPELGKLTKLRLLRLGNNSLTGQIPAALAGCTSLQILGLTQNNLVGSIPVSLLTNLKDLTMLALWKNRLNGTIPVEVSGLVNLTTLALYNNYFYGTIPAELGRLRKLQFLYLYRNSLFGEIPRQLGNCTSIIELDLSMNQLSGSIPASLAHLQGMRLLQLFQNKLTGTIPGELASLGTLQTIDLSINQLTGHIPVRFQLIPNLSKLLLAYNNLSGSIPPKLGYYSNLTVLDLTANQLNGSIPSLLCRNAQLSRLSLGSNNLAGNIPDRVKDCYSLTWLELNNNNFYGNIPPELSLLPHLVSLDLSENQFTGSIPAELGNLVNLSRLILSDNELSGSVPADLGRLSNLGSLRASGNKLSGSIPVELANCTNLQKLDLSSNTICGSIPPELSNLKKLMYLYLSDNQISGSIPVSLGDLPDLIELRLAGNLLTGPIPPDLAGLRSLSIALDLSRNQLSGSIPAELGELPLLMNLYLNQNNLTGPIPSTFTNSTNLLIFNVSYNNLTGNIPAIFNSSDISNFLSNPWLCGAPLKKVCPFYGAALLPYGENTSASTRRNSTKETNVQTIVGVVVGLIGLGFMAILALTCLFIRKPISTTPFAGDEEKLAALEEHYFCNNNSMAKPEFTFQDILEATGYFSASCEIGHGASGTVYKAKLPSGKTIAVKRVPSQREGAPMDNSFGAEIATLGRIRHSNIVKLYGFCSNHEANLLLYEYMTNGSVGELLHGVSSGYGELEKRSENTELRARESIDINEQACSSSSSNGLDWETRYQIAIGAAQGLAYLHHDCKPAIVHRDIKSNNILLDENMKAHVGDFGLAKILDVPYSMSMSAIAGTYGYIAPEYAFSMRITRKCDVYSFGVVLLELLTRKMAVQSVDQGGDLVTWVRTSIASKKDLQRDVFDSKLDVSQKQLGEMANVLKIALLCTSRLPLERPSMREVVSMLIGVREDVSIFVPKTNFWEDQKNIFTLSSISISNVSNSSSISSTPNV